MIHEELLGGQKVFKDCLIDFEIPIHHPVGLLDQEARGSEGAPCRILIVAVTPLAVLEDLGCMRVTKELTEKPHQLRMRGFVRAHVLAADLGVYRPTKVALVIQKTDHLSPVILPGSQSTLSSGLSQA